MRKYNNSWNAKKLTVNFNQKQWRQDLAAFMREKKYWNEARVTRSRIVKQTNNITECVKEFQIYNKYGANLTIQYINENKIISNCDIELINKYFELRH